MNETREINKKKKRIDQSAAAEASWRAKENGEQKREIHKLPETLLENLKGEMRGNAKAKKLVFTMIPFHIFSRFGFRSRKALEKKKIWWFRSVPSAAAAVVALEKNGVECDVIYWEDTDVKNWIWRMIIISNWRDDNK